MLPTLTAPQLEIFLLGHSACYHANFTLVIFVNILSHWCKSRFWCGGWQSETSWYLWWSEESFGEGRFVKKIWGQQTSDLTSLRTNSIVLLLILNLYATDKQTVLYVCWDSLLSNWVFMRQKLCFLGKLYNEFLMPWSCFVVWKLYHTVSLVLSDLH